MKGVASCVVGYSGGKAKDPTYRNMQDHTEAFLVEFDPSVVSFEDLVLSWTQKHSPNYKSKCQYRSAVWYLDEEQKEVAEDVVNGWKASAREPLFTSVEPALTFFRGEEYHQYFLSKRGGNTRWA
jgi:peptide-methionine (S)-S-oxide reductase